MENQQGNQNTEQLLQLIEVLLDKSRQDTPEVRESLASLFDLLLWAEKRSEATLQTVISSKLMVIVLEKYKGLTDLLLSGYILLLGNAKDQGLLVGHLLENHLPDRVLSLYLNHLSSLQQIQEQQHLHLIGSYLKAYHRHLTSTSIPHFIEDNRCLLITICCQFFNCPQEITRTSIMNILMNILKLPFASKLLVYPQVRRELRGWCMNMCCLLRNELKDFDQNLLTTEESESEYIIHLINDKIFLWEDLSELSEQLFSEAFYHQIIIPLVIGSLNTSGIPLFTLKFALFILNKLVKTIKNLDLLNELGSLLFVSQEVSYKDSQLATASLKPFNLHKIVSQPQPKQPEEDNQDETNEFKQVNQLFLNILRSKDSRFLQCVCILILNILTEVKRSPKSINFYIKELGFGIDGHNTITISQILINQFNAIHTLQINRMICSLLIYIQPTKYLTDEVKFRFTHVYKQHVDQALSNLEKYKDKYDYICEVMEYDAKQIASNAFNFQMEIKTDAALIFNNQIIDNQVQPFYRQIPETDHHLIRYNLVKTLLLRKLAVRVIEECAADKTFQKYLERMRQADAAYIKPGEYLKLPIDCNSYRCKLVDQKIEIPNCLMLQDESNLIVGYLQNMQVKIILNIKLKHISPFLKAKKEKIYAEIEIRKYDHQMQDIIQMRGITLKYIQTGVEYFRNKKGKVKDREVGNIFQILKNSKNKVPLVSLI